MKTFKLAVMVLIVVSLSGLALAEPAKQHFDRGGEAVKTGQYDQAITHYNKALELNSSYAEAYLNRGIANARKGRADQAIADFNKAIELNPDYVKAYYNRALAFCMKKEYGRAWEDVHKAETLGYKPNPEFLEKLRRASKRSE